MKLVTKYQISAINSSWEKCDEKCAYMFNVYRNQPSRQTGSRNLTGPKMLPTIWHTYMKLVTKYQIPVINSCWEKWAYMFNVYKNQQNRQTGSRNLMGPKTLSMIWGTYMKLVTKYQISAINSCWEKCNEKWTYMFNVYKNQQSRQTGSRNLTGPKALPTIWYTYMMLVTKYQISVINSYWEKCDEKYLGRTEGRTKGQTEGRAEGRTDRRREVKQYTLSTFGERKYNKSYTNVQCTSQWKVFKRKSI
jgi:ribosome biogenesis protein Tsr3